MSENEQENANETAQPESSNGLLGQLARQVEAMLLASDEPLSPSRISVLTGATRKQIREAVEALNSAYERGGHSFRVESIADGYQMLTVGEFNSLLEQLLAVRKDSKLSQAALETLAVVAYKQPVTRIDVEVVRGVACGEVLRSLMEKRLVKIVGRAEILGRPMLYGTTRRFLEIFGLRSIEDLPKAEQLADPDTKDLGPKPAEARAEQTTPAPETGAANVEQPGQETV
jgi:segregation and condensation protein B